MSPYYSFPSALSQLFSTPKPISSEYYAQVSTKFSLLHLIPVQMKRLSIRTHFETVAALQAGITRTVSLRQNCSLPLLYSCLCFAPSEHVKNTGHKGKKKKKKDPYNQGNSTTSREAILKVFGGKCQTLKIRMPIHLSMKLQMKNTCRRRHL